MRNAIIAAILGLLISMPAHAETAKFAGYKDVGRHRICYYSFDGLTLHYVLANDSFMSDFFASCASTMEVPFSAPRGWAVLLKDQVDPHNPMSRDCYYGLRTRLFIRPTYSSRACYWTIAPEATPPSPREVVNVGEERVGRSGTKLCYYSADESGPRTHFRALSIYDECPEKIGVS